ncbi:hypothetical protein CLAIMM_07464 [Cladophialophora immunda]|nr:hypothetical protein CLAIMM_07464 [Cladophialophora immunda]
MLRISPVSKGGRTEGARARADYNGLGEEPFPFFVVKHVKKTRAMPNNRGMDRRLTIARILDHVTCCLVPSARPIEVVVASLLARPPSPVPLAEQDVPRTMNARTKTSDSEPRECNQTCKETRLLDLVRPLSFSNASMATAGSTRWMGWRPASGESGTCMVL